MINTTTPCSKKQPFDFRSQLPQMKTDFLNSLLTDFLCNYDRYFYLTLTVLTTID